MLKKLLGCALGALVLSSTTAWAQGNMCEIRRTGTLTDHTAYEGYGSWFMWQVLDYNTCDSVSESIVSYTPVGSGRCYQATMDVRVKHPGIEGTYEIRGYLYRETEPGVSIEEDMKGASMVPGKQVDSTLTSSIFEGHSQYELGVWATWQVTNINDPNDLVPVDATGIEFLLTETACVGV